MSRTPRYASATRNPHGWEDRLISVYRHPDGRITAKGKRVGRDCPLTSAERRAYVACLGSPATMVRLLRDNRGLSLSDAWDVLMAARGETRPLHRDQT